MTSKRDLERAVKRAVKANQAKASKRGRGVLRKDGKPRESNTGTLKPVVDDSNWRVKATGKHRIKFDDPAKARYLGELARTGRKWSAEQAAGVARSTVDAHLKNDPDFAEAYEDAAAAYSTPRLVRIENDLIEGHEELTYDAEGNLIKEKRNYETRLREMFLKKHDPGYTEKAHLELSGKVGIVVVPGMVRPDDWAQLAAEHDRQSALAQDPDAGSSATH